MFVHHLSSIPFSLENIANNKSFHVLTDAHIGFSVLGTTGRAYGVELRLLQQFADEVNLREELGSLHPRYPITAVPKKYTRTDDLAQKQKAIEFLREFLQLNKSTMHASKIIFDFQGFLGRAHFEECIEGFESQKVEDIYFIYPSAQQS